MVVIEAPRLEFRAKAANPETPLLLSPGMRTQARNSVQTKPQKSVRLVRV